MTTIIERPPTPSTSRAPAPIAQKLTANQQLFRSLLPKDFAKGQRLQGQELQQDFDKLLARYYDSAREPEKRFTSVIQTDPTNPRTLEDCRNAYDLENRVLYSEMNKHACRATAINATLAKEAARLLTEVIEARVAYEKTGWPDCLPYVEGGFVAALRRLVAHFTSAAAKTTTSADVSGKPKEILIWFFDIV